MSSEQIIAIVVEDKIYEVDKKKLIEKSDYFRALFSSGMRESTEDCVQLQGLSVPGLELVLEFINTSKVQVVNETLEDLIETASFLQVTSILKLLTSEIRLDNCVDLYGLSEVYGAHDLRTACLKYLSCYYHPMLRRPEFGSLPPAVRDQVREMRMKGTATLVAIGDFTCLSLDGPDQDEPWSMLRYGEGEQRWKPLANNLPPDMINVRWYGSAVLDNYLFIVGGYRTSSQEISAVHCYNPCRNEWNQVAPLNQKRSVQTVQFRNHVTIKVVLSPFASSPGSTSSCWQLRGSCTPWGGRVWARWSATARSRTGGPACPPCPTRWPSSPPASAGD